MTSGKNTFPKADKIVGLASLCVAVVVGFSLTREDGIFSGTIPGSANSVKQSALNKLKSIKKEGGRSLDDPTLPAYINKGYALFQQAAEEERAGNNKSAMDLYKQACKIDPIRKMYWSGLGNSYMHENQFDLAQAAFMEVYNRDVYDTFNLSNLGYVCQSLRRDDEAQRYYLSALTLQPDLQAGWAEMYNIARGLGMQRYYDQIRQASLTPADGENIDLAYQLNQQGLEDHPDDYYYHVNRALINLRFMRLTTVKEDIDQALKVNKDGPAALIALGQMYTNMGDTDKAAQAFKRCLAVSPQPVAYAELGAIEAQAGHLDEAVHDYGLATELGNDKPSWVVTFNKLRDEKFKRQKQAANAALPKSAAASGPDVSGAK